LPPITQNPHLFAGISPSTDIKLKKRDDSKQKQLQVRGNLNLKSSQSSKAIEMNDEDEKMPNVSRFETEG